MIAIDADPDTNLAAALGIKDADKIIPLVELKELIKERTGSTSDEFGKFFKLNPTVNDLPEKLFYFTRWYEVDDPWYN